jgi:chromosome segregation ATPase
MANENKNIKELVSEDDDPTAELEIPSFRDSEFADSDEHDEHSESDSHTYGLAKRKSDDSGKGQTIPELKSDLESRAKTIGKLQYDIEQLRAKWLGLEAEIGAREEIANNLLQEVDKLKKTIARKDNLLGKRNDSIKALKSEIQQREEAVKELEQDLETQRTVDADNVSALDEANHELRRLLSKLEIAETEIASMETTIGDRDEQIARLEQQLAEQRAAGADHVSALEDSQSEARELRTKLENAVQAEKSVRIEASRRDDLYALLEKKTADLENQLSTQRTSDAEHLQALQESQEQAERLRLELQTTRKEAAAELAQARETTSNTVRELRAQLTKTEEYADTLRHKFQDLNDSLSGLMSERESLQESNAQLTASIDELSTKLASVSDLNTELRASVEQLRADHEAEIRTLRFELGEAQDTLAQTGDLNSQLASELVDAHGHKEELEQMLARKEENAEQSIANLEKKIRKLAAEAEAYEQKLETKNTAINVLLGELSKKSEQIDSIGEIENVIHEIDSRMSERFDEAASGVGHLKGMAPIGGDRDRITRVLVGSIGDQELRFPLFKNRLTIGRTAENDIQLKTAYISRRHAVVVTEGDATRVIDWGSKNGVYVNSKRVKEQVLSNGDIVSVGNAKFRYEERPKRES